MAKFHLNNNDEVGKCTAEIKCPFGGESGIEKHYDTFEEAQFDSEIINERKHGWSSFHRGNEKNYSEYPLKGSSKIDFLNKNLKTNFYDKIGSDFLVQPEDSPEVFESLSGEENKFDLYYFGEDHVFDGKRENLGEEELISSLEKMAFKNRLTGYEYNRKYDISDSVSDENYKIWKDNGSDTETIFIVNNSLARLKKVLKDSADFETIKRLSKNDNKKEISFKNRKELKEILSLAKSTKESEEIFKNITNNWKY